MNGYLTKPIIIEDLITLLKKFLKGENIAQSPLQPERKVDHDETSPPRFDLSALLSRTMGDRDFTKKVVEVFFESTPESMEALRKAIETSDAKAIARWAHTLKGSAANIGGMRLSEIAREINQAAEAGNLDALSEQFSRLEAEFEALQEEVFQELVRGNPS
jgi:HPt (histidine-containing phosphotransfer) domain-containing protein